MGRVCGKTVLVVDDDQVLLDLLACVLEDKGYRVERATDGRQGLEAVGRSMPHLILLDMNMPVMTGWEFARELHARYDRSAPIVVVSASDDARRWAEEIGACQWIRKPFDLDSLLSVVRQHAGI